MLARHSHTYMNQWKFATIILLAFIVSYIAYGVYSKQQGEMRSYQSKYDALKKKYIELANTQINVLETFATYPTLKTYYGAAYSDLDNTKFAEKVREKIAKLKLE